MSAELYFLFFLLTRTRRENYENLWKRIMVIELINVRKFTHILLAHISYILHGPIINVQTDLSVGSYSYWNERNSVASQDDSSSLRPCSKVTFVT